MNLNRDKLVIQELFQEGFSLVDISRELRYCPEFVEDMLRITPKHTRKVLEILSLIEYNENKCWSWIGDKFRKGYPCYKSRLVYRILFKTFHGYLPRKPYVVMHICENATCTNWSHYEIGSHQENMFRRSHSISSIKS